MNAVRNEKSKPAQQGKRVSRDTKINSAIAELSRSLLSRASIKDISSLVLRHAQSLTNSKLGFVGYIDEDTGCLVVPTFVGDIWDICGIKDKTFVFKDFSGLWGWVLQNRKPLLSNKPSGDHRSSGTPSGHLPIHRFLSVPSLVQGKLVGQIALANSERNYTKKDIVLVDQLASIFADAIYRTRTEKALKESEDLYRTIFETTGNATIIVEEDMSISMVNMECEKLFGYSKEEIVGLLKWDQFIAEEDRERLREYHCLRRIDADGVPKNYETRVIDRQGNEKEVFITASLIPATKKSIISIMDITKHKQAQEELRKSEEEYRTLIENVNIGIYRSTGGPYGQFLQANPAMIKMFGYDSSEEFLKVPLHELYQDREERKRFVGKIQKQGFVKDETLRLRKKDGTFMWGSVTAKVQEDTNGEIKWIDGAIEDITERKRAEDALFESEGRFRSFFNSATDSFYVLDKNGIIIQFNIAVVNALGYTDDELLGADIAHFFTPASQEIWRKEFPAIFNQKFVKFIRLEIDVVRKDGKIINVDCTASAVCNERGDVVNIVVLQKDITKRKRAEERLVQSLEALHSVYNIATTMRGSYETSCDQVVFNLSKLLKVSYVSVQYIEVDQVKIISSISDGTFSHNKAFALEHSPCAVVVEKNGPCQMKGPLQQFFPGNELISMHNFKTHIGVPVINIEGRVTGFICAMDYIEREFSEDEIRLIEIFARYVAYEYERNIMEAQLRQFDRMKLLGQMAAGVAHEVRNPLNAILAITEALFQDIGDNPEYQPFLDHIRTQVDRLSRLMGDLLDLGKPIQSSSLHMEYLPAICTATLDLWQQTPLSQSHRVRLSLPPEQDDLNIMADSSKLQQVFLNLLENAAQHSPEGSEIRFVVTAPKKATARICVIDQGTGVLPENIQRVFEPFFTTRNKGNGLGLSIVKNIMQALGGDIMIRNNEIPPGCTVEIILPLVQEGQS
jgi:PAS domain S-box-containing protein